MPNAIDRRRTRVRAAWGLSDEVVLVAAGVPVPIEGSDQYHPFVPHPDFRYLADVEVPGAVLAHDAVDGSWELFAPRLTKDELVWEAPPPPVGRPLDELDGWLAARSGRPVVRLGAGGTSTPLASAVAEARVTKDADELERMRAAAAMSAHGYEVLFSTARAGLTERQLQIELEAGFFRAGAARTAYDTIVASGPNAATLHFLPTGRVVRPGDFVLVDAGAAHRGYASDVTRTFVVGAEPSADQRFVWELVAQVQAVAVDRCRPGTEWRDVHLEAARSIAAGLVEFGVLRGEPGELVEQGAAALFFPHGLGHLLGITVHDAGGYPPGRERSTHPQLRYLRTDRPLQPGMVTTVEPGVYFIEALLADGEVRTRHRDHVDWGRVDELLGLGGVRIEDDVLVTTGDPEVLTEAIAKPVRVG